MKKTKQLIIYNKQAQMPILYQRLSQIDLEEINRLNKRSYFKKEIFFLNELIMNHLFIRESSNQIKLVDQFYLLIDLKNCSHRKTILLVGTYTDKNFDPVLI